MDSQRREEDPVGADLTDRDVAGEETETPDGLERGGPAGTMPVGPAVDDPSEGDPRAPGPARGGREAPDPPREGGGDAGPRGADVEQKPIGSWIDDDDTEGLGARQPPGG